MTELPTATRTLDAKGLNCPLPLLKAKKELATMRGGEVLHVLATDPNTLRDFAGFAAQAGHGLLRAEQVADIYHIVLRKA